MIADPILKNRIKLFAEKTARMGIIPLQFWYPEKLPTAIEDEFQELLDLGAVEMCAVGEGERMARFYVCQELSQQYVEDETVEKNYDNRSYPVKEKKDLLIETYPELKARFDKYGLVEVPKTVSIAEEEQRTSDLGSAHYGMTYKNNVLLLDRFFRRTCGKHNHFNVDIIEHLERYRRKELGTLKVRLDTRMIAPLGAYRYYFEKDYWHGRHFSIADLDNPRATGFTVHSDGQEFLSDGNFANRTEFLWYLENEDVKTLEIEELWSSNKPLESNFVKHEDKIHCRFIHCRRDIKNGKFVHLDGSINLYSEDEYERRLKTRLGRNSKLGEHVKVFRIDGEIPFDDFQNIVTYFFRGNKLVPEYLENTGSFALEID